MKCAKCGVAVSRLTVLKGLSTGQFACPHCAARYKVRERGFGLSILLPVMGIVVAGLLTLIFSSVSIPLWAEATSVVIAIALVIVVGLALGIEVTPLTAHDGR